MKSLFIPLLLACIGLLSLSSIVRLPLWVRLLPIILAAAVFLTAAVGGFDT